jgi:hypothetical protein
MVPFPEFLEERGKKARGSAGGEKGGQGGEGRDRGREEQNYQT